MNSIISILILLTFTTLIQAQFPSMNRMPTSPAKGVQGLAVVINFADTPKNKQISNAAIERLYNQPDYARFGNNGSVRDYYIAMSNGAYDITHTVIQYTTNHPKEYYTYQQYQSDHHLLLNEVTKWLTEGTGLNPDRYDSDADGIIDALTLLYTDTPSGGWGNSLWPHISILEKTASWHNFTVDRYAVVPVYTHSPGQLSIGTICHELGHLLFQWPDITPSNASSANHSGLMGTGLNPSNPLPPSPLYRIHERWSPSFNLSINHDTTLTLSSKLNSPIYQIQNPQDTDEYLLLEYRTQKGRYSSSNLSGLLIYHVAPLDSSRCDPRISCFPKTTLLDQNALYWDNGTKIELTFSLGHIYETSLSLTIQSTNSSPETSNQLPPRYSLTQTESHIIITATTESPFTATIFSITGIELISDTGRNNSLSIERRHLLPGVNHLYIKSKKETQYFTIGQW
ncbi:MAG: M6 family metalloprotease domain-containing protein [Fibrobacterales bacterium]